MTPFAHPVMAYPLQSVALCLTALLMSWGCANQTDEPRVPANEFVWLSNGVLDIGEAEALAQDPALASARSLRLVEMHIGDAGLAALARSPHLGNIHHFKLARVGITNLGLAALSMARNLRPVRLSLGPADVDHLGMELLLRSPVVEAVTELMLNGRLGGDRTVEALVATPLADHLVGLDLWMDDLSDTGVRALMGSPRFGKLERLELQPGSWSAASLLPLADPRHLPRLRTLTIYRVPVKPEILAAIAARRPGLRVEAPQPPPGGEAPRDAGRGRAAPSPVSPD